MSEFRKRVDSLRTSVRLSLQFSLLYAVLSAFVFMGAYWFTDYEVRDWLTDQMEGDTGTFKAIYDEQGLAGLQTNITTVANVSFENARIYQLQDAEGSIIGGNIATVLSDDISSFLPVEEFNLNSGFNDEVAGYWMLESNIGPYKLFQGSGNHIVAEVLEAVGIALGVGYLVVIGLGLLLGVRVGRVTEERITEISDTLALAAQGNLGARIQVEGDANDDLSRISKGINSALDQLRRLLESQEQISNDIAHDLRTPLQRLRQRIEKMRGSDMVSAEDIDAALRQTEDIISTFNALLRIAQIEAQDRKSRFDQVDLNGIVGNVADLFEPTAEDLGKTLTFKACKLAARVHGDASMLTQLFSNLTENAISHCPDGTSISLTIECDQELVCVRVADDGPGIAAKDRERVFQRFFRTEDSRSTSGNGLGLTLAKAIAEMHGGEIVIEDQEVGTVFAVKIAAI